MKLLIVDDVSLEREITKMALEDTAREIMMASDGKEALEVMKSYKPDIVLMDLFMPKMNGDECCRRMRVDPDLHDIPVLIISATDDHESKRRCLISGCDDIIKKPFSKDDLMKKIERHIK